MSLSHLFFTTLRDDPNDAEMPSHRLLVRAGYVRQLGSGIYSLLPLGFRVAKRVEQVIREEMDRIGCQEMEMPVVPPAELGRETGGYDAVGPEMARFKDRAGRDMVLAMTHEEVVADLLRDIVRSYRQLPMMVYHFQTKWRDEPRARGGLIRVREFVMQDSYSCDLDLAGLDVSYERHYEAYTRIFERLGLRAIAVASDVGMMGGSQAHEFMVLNSHGEDVLVLCETCGFSANRQVATVRFSEPPASDARALEEVATPGATTIADLAAYLGVSAEETAKAIFFVDREGRLITAIVRGDMDVNETKLANAAKAADLRPARTDEIEAAAVVPGYASPTGARGTFVVGDELVGQSSQLRHRRRASPRLRRRGAARREGDRLAGGGRAVRRPPRLAGCREGPARRGSRWTAPRPGPCGRPRDPVGRPRRIAGREVHRRRAAGDAHHPDRQPTLARGGRRRGDCAGDRRAFDRTARRRGGASPRLSCRERHRGPRRPRRARFGGRRRAPPRGRASARRRPPNRARRMRRGPRWRSPQLSRGDAPPRRRAVRSNARRSPAQSPRRRPRRASVG